MDIIKPFLDSPRGIKLAFIYALSARSDDLCVPTGRGRLTVTIGSELVSYRPTDKLSIKRPLNVSKSSIDVQ